MGALGGCILLGVLLLPGWIRPSIEADRIRVGSVDFGPVESSVSATGHVVPAFEKVVSSPVEARVVRVLHRPGAELAPGDEIVELDLSGSRLELDRLQERVAQKQWEVERARANSEVREGELAERLEIARLDLEIAAYRNKQQEKLHRVGLVTEESRREAEVTLRKAELEVVAAERAVEVASREARSDRHHLNLELEIQIKEREDAARRLELATARSDRTGVLTWVVAEEGSMVARGGVLARIADLHSFRVEATISDIHASKLAPSRAVQVQLDDERISGLIESVYPTIENGVVRFLVALDQSSHEKLRNNLRVDVDVLTERKGRVLRIPRSSFVPAGRVVNLFVVQEDRLERRRVSLGVRGVEWIEVVGGLEEGDEVVLSDLREFDYLEQISLDGVFSATP